MELPPAVIEDDSIYIFIPEPGEQSLTAKSIEDFESIIRRYPHIQPKGLTEPTQAPRFDIRHP